MVRESSIHQNDELRRAKENQTSTQPEQAQRETRPRQVQGSGLACANALLTDVTSGRGSLIRWTR
jgi:hypothetical protein